MPSTSARQRSNDDRPRDITAPIVVAAVASPLTAAAKAEAVKAYIDQNQLAQTVESAVNSVLSRRPADCFGSMADVLGAEHGAAPVVERVVLGDGQQLCAQGNPCLSVDLIGQWRDRKVVGRLGARCKFCRA